MKYAVIDIETTGTDPVNNQILEIGAILEDATTNIPIDELPKFKCIVQHEIYNGSAFAVNMNVRIFKILAEYESLKGQEKDNFRLEHNILSLDDVPFAFNNWLLNSNYSENDKNFKINIAGKNFGAFDKLFLDKSPKWSHEIKYHRRFIDPAVLYVDWKIDTVLPSLDECLKRAGINRTVTHNALEDCIDVLLCLRAKY